MLESAKEDEQPPDTAAELDAAVEHAIEACGGDLLATIRDVYVAGGVVEVKLGDGCARG